MTLAVTSAQRHALVQVQGINVYWHTMTGGGMEASTTPDPDDPNGDPITGDVIASDITLTTWFSPHDQDWVRELKRAVGHGQYTIVRQWTDENWSRVGDPEVYPQCLLVGYTNPVSAPTGEPAEFSVTFSTTGEAL